MGIRERQKVVQAYRSGCRSNSTYGCVEGESGAFLGSSSSGSEDQGRRNRRCLCAGGSSAVSACWWGEALTGPNGIGRYRSFDKTLRYRFVGRPSYRR